MPDLMATLRRRGFVEKTTHGKELEDYLKRRRVTCYIGFDPTASSLHIGSLVPIMSLAHMQRSGHRPIALIGGGTGLVGDPSGKTEMRKLLTPAAIDENALGIKKQLSRFIEFADDGALLLNNAEWLSELAYIPFLRDIGRHFSVNKMMRAESYRMRIESEEGLSFIEFNYMLLQAYDFLQLYDDFGCCLQMGGSDQWGNIVAGIDLVRKMRQGTVFGITFPLITTSGGAKMGKTASGAVWLDGDRTSPYDYYQYWVNTDDRDVTRFLALFTFLPMDEIEAVGRFQGADINSAKTVLAFEATSLAHGQEEAVRAYHAASSMFGERRLPKSILPTSLLHDSITAFDDSSVPHTVVARHQFQPGIPAFRLFQMVGLAASGGAARRLIAQGGAYMNGCRIDAFDHLVSEKDIQGNEIMLRSGKKRFHRVRVP